ncbi:uncharacterized protein LOC131541447 isoform X2 [Onychostoma macrolepis]|uniref:uncharacterized protein LOC131541447 isoform X2 n=1 Tax=Onychostoma macrolepis TaxID=369639 RepID=UPI00272CAB21|nr:uncharacterized protein LOC131541447 isoform X2 [Onychostoma macrolepis]
MAKANKDDFQLVLQKAGKTRVEWGSDITVPCHLSPEISAVDMEIRWFKETDCVCLYKNRQMFEGRGYKGRVSLFTEELDRGNVSLQLQDFGRSDVGDYLCQVTRTDRTEEITIRVGLLQGGFRNRNTLKGALVGAAVAVAAGAAVAGPAAAAAAAAAVAVAGPAAAGAAAGAAGAYFFKPEINLTTDMIHKTWSKKERMKMTESSLLPERRNSKESPPDMSVKPTQKQK